MLSLWLAVLPLVCSTGVSSSATSPAESLFYLQSCDPTTAENVIQLGTNIGQLRHCSHLCLEHSWCRAFTFQSGTCSGMDQGNLSSLRVPTTSGSNEVQVYVPSQSWPVPRAAPKVLIQRDTRIGTITLPCSPNCVAATCAAPPKHPMNATGTFAASINGKITLCGGGANGVSNISSCYALNPTTNTWDAFPPMSVARYAGAGAIVNAGWWITGGYNTPSGYLSSSEILNLTSLTWTTGPSLPSARNVHCVAAINSTHTFLGGGYGKTDAYLYRWSTGQWLALPNLSTNGGYQGCTARLDKNGNAWGVIVVGDSNTVQAYDLTQNTKLNLPNLPLSSVASAVFIRDGTALFLINIYGNNYMVFNESASTFSVVAGSNTIGVANSDATAIAVIDASLSC